MDNIKTSIAKNIIKLRTENKMTQIELAEKLNYSDKAVSKWERAESVPDITVLCQIAALFGVSLDYLVGSNEENKNFKTDSKSSFKKRNHAIITGISILLVWFVATFIFIVADVFLQNVFYHYLIFIYAAPVSLIVWLVFNSMWFNTKRNYFIISLLVWSSISAFYLTLLCLKFNFWQIFFLGIPGQIIIFMWSGLKSRKKM